MFMITTGSQRTKCYTYLRQGKVNNSYDHPKLEPGASVKYISKDYLPRHCIESFGEYNEAFEVAVYSQYGIGLVYTSDLDWHC